MIRSTRALEELDAKFRQKRLASLTHQDALAIYAALWAYARQINPDTGSDWQRDVQPDIILARVLNGLPVTS